MRFPIHNLSYQGAPLLLGVLLFCAPGLKGQSPTLSPTPGNASPSTLPASPAAGTNSENGPFEVEIVKGITYDESPSFPADKHKLDLFIPKGKQDYPVVLFVHGGGWTIGDRSHHWPLGKLYASNGIGMAIMSYRLSPFARHPDHIEDVAKAFSWVHEHICEYGGNTEEIFLCGHSAGAHLASLLTTNDQYLKKENLEVSAIKGVIPISGIYQLRHGWPDETPRRGWDWPGRRWRSHLVFPLMEMVVGSDEESVTSASPLLHVTGKEPPFLLFHAKKDISGLGKMACDFHKELKKKGVPVECHEIPDRTHATILFQMMFFEKDPVNQKIMDFIGRHTARPEESALAREK